MTATVILNDFKAPQMWRNKYRRSTYEIWDANLHHGDVRPFACPEFVCGNTYEQIFVDRSCECGGFDIRLPLVNGFSPGSYYVVSSGTLKHGASNELCSDESLDWAGAPVPNVIISPTPNCNGCDIIGVSYVITYVVSHNGVRIESSPSEPTEIVSGNGSVPFVILVWDSASGAMSNYNIVATRLYRTESTFEDGEDSIPSDGSEYVFVKEFSGGAGQTFVDNVHTNNTGGPLLTYDPMSFPAPYGGIVDVTRTQDGIVVAEQNRLFISEPGKPQFSYDGIVQIEDTIIAIEAIGNTIFVLTDNKPVKIAYRHTDGIMSIDRQVIERRLPLTSRESVSVYGGRVYFASTHSLYLWDTGGYGADISSALTTLITPEQWRNIGPTSVVGVAHEFGYIMSSDNLDYSLMIELAGDGADTINATSMVPISYINPISFGLDYDGHIMFSDLTGTYRWDYRRLVDTLLFNIQDNTRPRLQDQCDCCPWKLTMYFDNEGKNRFSKMRVEWDERSATHLNGRFYLKAFGNEEELTDGLEIISSRGFSIPKHQSSQTFCVEVSGCGIMQEIRLATSNQELVSNSNNLIGNAGAE